MAGKVLCGTLYRAFVLYDTIIHDLTLYRSISVRVNIAFRLMMPRISPRHHSNQNFDPQNPFFEQSLRLPSTRIFPSFLWELRVESSERAAVIQMMTVSLRGSFPGRPLDIQTPPFSHQAKISVGGPPPFADQSILTPKSPMLADNEPDPYTSSLHDSRKLHIPLS